MSTVLKAYGDDFDVDTYLNGCTLPVCAVKRKGEPVFPSSQPAGRRHIASGIHITVSDADFDDLAGQVAESIAFLQENAEQLQRLCRWPGIKLPVLDFGINRREAAVQCDCFPAELLRLAGELGIGIELSQYPTRIDEPTG